MLDPSPMLQALLHGKLDRWLTKDAYAIEDLLTSVVLGSAYYAPPEQALLPFLGKAVDEHGHELGVHLSNVASVTAELWPNWSAFEDELHAKGHDSAAVEVEAEVEADEDSRDGCDTAAADESDETDDTGPRSPDASRPSSIAIARSQPEVVIEVTRTDGTRQLILIEAKLHSGKSSHASGPGFVTDQLAKYWRHLQREAARRSAEALAVVYLTKSSWPPHEELAASQRELEGNGCPRAPLYWLSWRTLVEVVDVASAALILRDCVALLRDRWQLVTVRMDPWPIPPQPLPQFVFGRRFPWAMPTSLPRPWSFDRKRVLP